MQPPRAHGDPKIRCWPAGAAQMRSASSAAVWPAAALTDFTSAQDTIGLSEAVQSCRPRTGRELPHVRQLVDAARWLHLRRRRSCVGSGSGAGGSATLTAIVSSVAGMDGYGCQVGSSCIAREWEVFVAESHRLRVIGDINIMVTSNRWGSTFSFVSLLPHISRNCADTKPSGGRFHSATKEGSTTSFSRAFGDTSSLVSLPPW